MRKHLYAVFIILNFLSIPLLSQDYTDAIKKARFLISEHQKQTNIPAVQLAVMIDGEMIWSETMGYSDLDNNIKATNTTLFRTASVSKPLTSIALGKMIEDSLIHLDQTVADFLPDYPVAGKNITIRQLAGSISGIRHYKDSDPTYRFENYETVEDALILFKNDPLEFEPGTQYGYSSYGWVLLSALMEKAKGISFEDIMNETWKELEAEHTLFDKDNRHNNEKSNFYIKGKREERVLAPSENRSYMYAGGGYLSTAEDLARIGNKFINYEYLLKTTVDTLTKSLTLNNHENTYYALGWEIGSSKLNTPAWYHNGSLPTARSHWVLLPKEKLSFAYLSNTGQHVFFNNSEAHSIVKLFLEARCASTKSDSQTKSISGVWEGKITSLYGKNKKARLKLHTTADGITSGTLSYTRSRKNETYPIIVSSIKQDSIHLTGVTPMFAAFNLKMDAKGNLTGGWQHEFVRKPNEKTDDFWKVREVKLEKKE